MCVMAYLETRDAVHVLYLGEPGGGDDEARFHPDRLAEIHRLLDQVEQTEGPAALVTTNVGKFFTNGLDLEYIFPRMDELDAYLDTVHALYRRLVALPMPTIAAINGHAYGAGAMLATAHDFRHMRADRGFYCLPEVTLKMPFTHAMGALITRRLTPQVALEAMTTGRRYSGPEALERGIVDAVAEEADLLDGAVARAAELAPLRGGNLGRMKEQIHAALFADLEVETTGTSIGD